MDIRNCRTCGRMYNYLSGPPICPACQKALEDKFQQVKEYLREKPDAHVAEVSEKNDVSVKQIKQWVREERLAFSGECVDGIECENCGKPIRTGRFCEACKNSMANTFQKAIDKPKAVVVEPPKEKEKNKMRFL